MTIARQERPSTTYNDLYNRWVAAPDSIQPGYLQKYLGSPYVIKPNAHISFEDALTAIEQSSRKMHIPRTGKFDRTEDGGAHQRLTFMYATVFSATQEAALAHPEHPAFRTTVAEHIGAARTILTGLGAEAIRSQVASSRLVSTPLLRALLDADHPTFKNNPRFGVQSPYFLKPTRRGGRIVKTEASRRAHGDAQARNRTALTSYLENNGVKLPRDISASSAFIPLIVEARLWHQASRTETNEVILIAQAARMAVLGLSIPPERAKRTPFMVRNALEESRELLRTHNSPREWASLVAPWTAARERYTALQARNARARDFARRQRLGNRAQIEERRGLPMATLFTLLPEDKDYQAPSVLSDARKRA